MGVEVNIAGGSVAGLLTAINLVHLGYSPTVYDPVLTSQAKERRAENGVLLSTPFLNHFTVSILGLNLLPESSIKQLNLVGNSRINRTLEKYSQDFLQTKPLYAVRMDDIQDVLQSRAEACGVEMKPDRVIDITMQNGEVVGIETAETTDESELVIDATGRAAKLAKLLKNHEKQGESEYVSDIIYPQPSRIIGMYVDMKDIAGNERVTLKPNTLTLGMLPNKTVLMLAPVAQLSEDDEAHASHLLLLEGDQKVIELALTNSIGNSPHERRLNAVQALIEHTSFEDVLNKLSAEDIESSLYFIYEQAEYHDLLPHGITSVGDAQGHTNPIFGRGIGMIARDVHHLMHSLRSNKDIRESLAEYKARQALEYYEILESTQKMFNRIRGLHHAVGLGRRLGNVIKK